MIESSPNHSGPSPASSLRHGILLVGHGTRDPSGTKEFFQLGKRLGEVLQDSIASTRLEPCLLEFQEPTIEQAWQSLVDWNAKRITVAPLLLFSAGHAKSDIPDEVNRLRLAMGDRAPCIDWVRPISRQSWLVELVRKRLRQSLGHLDKPGEKTAVVLVGRGSRDPCASADMRLLTEIAVRGKSVTSDDSSRGLVDEFGLSNGSLFTTFYAMATPRLPDTLESVANSGQFDRVVVQPHLLFAGRLYDAIQRQTQEAREKFASIEFVVSDYLGPCDEVAQAIAARIQAGVEGAASIPLGVSGNSAMTH